MSKVDALVISKSSAYDGYRQYMEGHDGWESPEFSDLPIQVQEAWFHAAKNVFKQMLSQIKQLDDDVLLMLKRQA